MKNTRRLYEEDSTCRSFCAVVLACKVKGKAFEAALDATAFYPAGGGQPADHGALGGARVMDVHIRDGVVWHTLTAPVHVGETVQGDVDWARRTELSQQHTGEHIVSGIVHAEYGYENVGFHIGEDAVTVDFNGPLTAQELTRLERDANWVVWKNQPVTAEFPSPEALEQVEYRSKKELTGAVRIVRVGQADVCACCGTHVRATGEVGLIKLLSAESYKGGVRVSLACGVRALRDYDEKQGEVAKLSALLSAKPTAVGDAAQRLVEENAALKARLAAAENRLFFETAQRYANSERAVCFFEELGPDSLRRACLALCEAATPGAVCCAFCAAPGGYAYAMGSREADVRAAAKALNEALAGRGGGKPSLAQGFVGKTKEEICAYFERAEA